MKITQKKWLDVEKNSRKIHGGRKSNLEHFSYLTLLPNIHGV
jgi:hypothetical protein